MQYEILIVSIDRSFLQSMSKKPIDAKTRWSVLSHVEGNLYQDQPSNIAPSRSQAG